MKNLSNSEFFGQTNEYRIYILLSIGITMKILISPYCYRGI